VRPQRITVQGFAAFREPTEIDLTDAELFALVGPTGAGKSSVIDAMVFALYGCVPRYDSENLVHPVITQGALEARVRLDFTSGGIGYSAARVVRRTKAGATTKEARLERHDDGEVLADDAKGLTSAVTELLGLDLEQFTKCVVLPQGAFATLLHDTKAKRQDLLVRLLDLGLYEQMASTARAGAKRDAFLIESLDEQLARASHATDEAVSAASAHVAAVDAGVDMVDEAGPALSAIDDERRAIDRELTTDLEALELLRGLCPPADLQHTVDAVASAADALARSLEAEAVATEAVEGAEKARAALPDVAELRQGLADHAALADLDDKVATGTRLLQELDEQRPLLVSARDAAAAQLDAATTALEATRIDHAAADLARHLHVGDDCPVCGSSISALPVFETADLTSAEERLASARDAERVAAAEVAEHDRKAGEYRVLLEDRMQQRSAVAGRLVDRPSAIDLEHQLAAVAAADAQLADTRAQDRKARDAVGRARAAAEQADQCLTAARAGFTAARDRLARLGPPPSGDDLAADWAALVRWADEQRTDREARSADARARRSAVDERYLLRIGAVADRVRAAGVPVPTAPGDLAALRDACLTEAATARARHQQLAVERDRAVELRAERAALDERRQVHELLADQLGARGFEAWLLDEALEVLLEGATRWLEQLSSGRYAMTVDDKNQFAVIDHANADERRLAKTLSGGETFLASLALALALAERVGELSSAAGRGLEAIFLDEGFGTLDPDTLDVVATAIEELGATGRMVGVVSHVPELAERVPVRFEITKGLRTSTVQRVET
jgi:exonuclease SbcC